MAQLLPDETRKLTEAMKDKTADLQNMEKKIIGFSHEELGAELLKSWHLPETLIAPTAHHHDLLTDEGWEEDIAIVHIANTIANNVQAPISLDDDSLLNPRALSILGITEEDVEKLHLTVYDQMDDLINILYYDLAA